MVAALAITPVAAGTTNIVDHRYRPDMGERTILPEGPQKISATPQARNEQTTSQPESGQSGASKFAAAVIAGALPPAPKTMDELIRRIGASDIPPESEARLRNIIA